MYDFITWLVGIGAGVWAGFAVWYSIRAKWWRNPVGVNAFTASIVIWLLLARIWGSRVIPGFRENLVISLVLYIAVIFAGVQRIHQMESAQRESGKMDDDERSTE